MALVLVIGLAGLVAAFMNAGSTREDFDLSAPAPAPVSAGASAPMLTPPGKVWSAEHGHWHDAPAGSVDGVTPLSGQGAVLSQPPGPAPPGKAWSAEHGHWHDILPPGTSPQLDGSAPAAGGPPFPQPDGPVPEGKAWSAEHGHWHNVAPPSLQSPVDIVVD